MRASKERVKLQAIIKKRYPDRLECNLSELCPKCQFHEDGSCKKDLLPVTTKGAIAPTS